MKLWWRSSWCWRSYSDLLNCAPTWSEASLFFCWQPPPHQLCEDHLKGHYLHFHIFYKEIISWKLLCGLAIIRSRECPWECMSRTTRPHNNFIFSITSNYHLISWDQSTLQVYSSGLQPVEKQENYVNWHYPWTFVVFKVKPFSVHDNVCWVVSWDQNRDIHSCGE